MSVIIRLQNLPWSANALDIRQFFKGLSIPDGGVHIVGGEMGDAFIAFSTDEDARQAMMHDREKINEVQVRLLLSSRAEMQKVIETARQQSLQALKNAGAISAIKPTLASPSLSTPTPQPPVITANSLHNILSSAAPSFLAYQKQAGITLLDTPIEANTPDAPAHGSSVERSRDRRRSSSRDRRRSRTRSRDRSDRNDRNSSRRGRRERSRSRSRDRDWKSRRSSRRSRSRERDFDRNRDRSVDRSRASSRTNVSNKERDNGQPSKSSKDITSSNKASIKAPDSIESSNAKVGSISAWGTTATNSYQTNNTDNIPTTSVTSPTQFSVTGSATSNILNPFNISNTIPGLRGTQLANSYTTSSGNNSPDTQRNVGTLNTPASNTLPGFQSYSSSVSTTNNYSINLFNANSNSSESAKPFALQNPYTASVQQATLNTNSMDSTSSATRSPTQQTNNTMFPGLSLMEKKPEVLPPTNPTTSNFASVGQLTQEPIAFANTNPYAQMYPNLFAQAAASTLTKPSNVQQKTREPEIQRSKESSKESCCIKISNMCSSTTYSDVRKFFAGLFIPHNGIKMLNDKHGIRIGVAYIQFSRVPSVHKALMRNNSILKSKSVHIEMVTDAEFEQVEDSYRPQGRFERGDRHYQDSHNDYDRQDDDNGGDSNYRGDRDSDLESKSEPFTVLYVEDIPSSAAEHDLMRMFSSYTIFDILLTPSRENRREYKGHVLFSRAEEAKAAFEDKSRHMIGYRKVRVRPATVEEMEREKEKLRLANEQLIKEEEALAEAERLKEEENQGEDDMDVADDTSSQACTDANNEPILDEPNNRKNSSDSKPPKIPSLFDIPTAINADMSRSSKGNNNTPSDPRLRRQKPSRFEPLKPEDELNLNRNVGNNDNGMNMNSNMGMNAMDSNCNMGMNVMGSSSNMGMNMSMNMGMNSNMGMNMMNMANNGNFLSSMMNNNNSRNMNNNNMNFNDMPMNNSSGMNKFILMKNCDYNTRMNDIAELLQSAFLRLKHIEPLRGERNMPTGEFIVEFQDSRDAESAIREFNNITFRQRKLRIRSIMPQEIADRIGKPFMNFFPGGGNGSGGRPFERSSFMGNNNIMSLNDGPSMRNFGSSSGGRYGNDSNKGRGIDIGNGNNSGGGSGSMMNRGGRYNSGSDRKDNMISGMRNRTSRHNNSGSSHDGHNSDQDNDVHIIDDSSNDVTICGESRPKSADGDDSANGGIPEKFTRPGCVVAMENVPYKAELVDILKFFSGYDLTPDDIIRRFNDDGTPTGDARVAFDTPSIARSAYNSRRRKQIFNRTIRLTLL